MSGARGATHKFLSAIRSTRHGAATILSSIALSAVLGVGALHAAAPPLSISWVSTDRSAFNPEKGEAVTLRFRVSAPADVAVLWLDQFDRPVRRMDLAGRRQGEQAVVWDGRDDAGNPVQPEAYVYVITAASSGEGSRTVGGGNPPKSSSPLGVRGPRTRGEDGPPKSPSPLRGEGKGEGALRKSPSTARGEGWNGGDGAVVYDLRGKTGGETVWPAGQALSPVGSAARVSYILSQAARVRLIVSRKDTLWPVRTLLDWEPRAAGRHEEDWDGWDAGWFVNASKTPNLMPVLYAFALPQNSVIVTGTPGEARGGRASASTTHPLTDSPFPRFPVPVHSCPRPPRPRAVLRPGHRGLFPRRKRIRPRESPLRRGHGGPIPSAGSKDHEAHAASLRHCQGTAAGAGVPDPPRLRVHLRGRRHGGAVPLRLRPVHLDCSGL